MMKVRTNMPFTAMSVKIFQAKYKNHRPMEKHWRICNKAIVTCNYAIG